MIAWIKNKFARKKKIEPTQPVTMDWEREPDFLRANHFRFIKEDDEAEYFGKMMLASAVMSTPLGTFNVSMGQTGLFVRREKLDGSYRLGIQRADKTDCSEAFTEDEFKLRLNQFETNLQNAMAGAK